MFYIVQVNDESLINLPHRKVLNIFRLAQGTVTLMIRRDSDEETDDLPPLPPDSPLPPESFRHYSTAEDINSFPIIDSLEEQETKPPNSLTSPLTPDSSGHRGVAEQETVLEERPDFHPTYCRALEETGPPVVPSSLPPQESNSSLQMKPPTPPESPLPLDNDETEPPLAPSASLLPQESTISLETEQPVTPKNPLQLDSMAPIEPVPSATLLRQGSTTSIETEPPIPPLSPLPHESTTSLDVTDQTLDISTASNLNSMPPADDNNLSDIDRLSMSPSDDEILSTKYSL